MAAICVIYRNICVTYTLFVTPSGSTRIVPQACSQRVLVADEQIQVAAARRKHDGGKGAFQTRKAPEITDRTYIEQTSGMQGKSCWCGIALIELTIAEIT